MGSSSYSDDHYKARVAYRSANNVATFAHTDDIRTGRKQAGVHDKLNPLGVKVRESRDSEAHPESLAIGVMFDETGSMGDVPVTLQKNLPKLMALLISKGYVEHPQILFGGIGDEYSDYACLQVGQFESGLEMDDDLTNIYLEQNGGGSGEESYQNAMYFFARHTSTDCWEKRQKKGYLFLIGDEWTYMAARKANIKAIIGDDLESDVPAAQIVSEVQERYHLFFILPVHGTSHGLQNKSRWQGLIGAENVLELKDNADICETIATAIGVCEGTVDLATAGSHMKDAGASVATIKNVTDSLSALAAKNPAALATVGTGDLPGSPGRSTAVTRL